MVSIILTKDELQKLHNLKGTNKQGYYCEVIVKHITEQVPDVARVTLIANKDNITKGDIRYHRYNDIHYIEVKKGRVWNNINKACIDGKYTYKGSKGTKRYRQNKGCTKEWLYNNTYDKITFVFKDKVYVIGNAQLFLATVRSTIRVATHKYNSLEDFNRQWYNTHNDFYIGTGVTGGITNSNKTYETYTIFVDIELFCDTHNIQYQVIKYNVTNISAVIHNSIMA